MKKNNSILSTKHTLGKIETFCIHPTFSILSLFHNIYAHY